MISHVTNFFEAQRYYTHMSWLFYGLFMVVALVQFVILFAVFASIVYAVTGEIGSSIWLWVIFLLFAYFGLGFLLAKKRLEQGGVSIAKNLNAVRLFVYDDGERHEPIFNRQHIRVGDSRDLPDSYKRYYEFATQMSIASGIVMPKLYVLPLEKGVNGFVAGFDDDDMVMVLTQGAVDNLSNAELYGLIGHEFGHILHGDAKLNLRLYVILSALAWVYGWVEDQDNKEVNDYQLNPHTHGRAAPPTEVMDKQAWVNYLRYDSQAFREKYEERPRQDYGIWDIPKVTNTGGTAIFIVAYLVIKMLSIFGMACAEWLKGAFNRQREHLADATSIQLTRNPDVVKSLQSLQTKYSPTLYNRSYSTYISHFFFASPEPNEVKAGMHTHPETQERIDALRLGQYDDFSREMTADMDIDKLEQAYQFVQNYAYQSPDEATKAPVQQNDEDDVKAIEFEAVTEKIVDGRLVVENWHLSKEDNNRLLYPKQVVRHQGFNGIIIDQMVLKDYELGWEIVRYFNKIVGVIAVVECALMCHHYTQIDPKLNIDLRSVFLPKTDKWTNHGQHGTTDSKFVHGLPQELLVRIACLDRRMDTQLVVKALLVLKKHLDNAKTLPITPKTEALLTKYSTGIINLLNSQNKQPETHQMPSSAISKLVGAASLLAMTGVLFEHQSSASSASVFHQICQTHSKVVFDGLGLSKNHNHIDNHNEQAMMVLLVFLVATQDNSLQMQRYDGMLMTIRRLLRLMGCDGDGFSDERLVVLCHQVQEMSADEWAVVLGGIDGVNFSSLLGTLQTAFVFDGKLGQVEYDVLCLLALAWGEPLPKAEI